MEFVQRWVSVWIPLPASRALWEPLVSVGVVAKDDRWSLLMLPEQKKRWGPTPAFGPWTHLNDLS